MPTLNEQIDQIIDGCTVKEQIEQLAAVKEGISQLEQAKTKAETDYRSLLKDYADVVKTSAYKVEDQSKVMSTNQNLSLEDFARDFVFNK